MDIANVMDNSFSLLNKSKIKTLSEKHKLFPSLKLWLEIKWWTLDVQHSTQLQRN